MHKITRIAAALSFTASALLGSFAHAKSDDLVRFDKITLNGSHDLSGKLFYLKQNDAPRHMVIAGLHDNQVVLNVFADFDTNAKAPVKTFALPANVLFFGKGNLAGQESESILLMTATALLTLDIQSGQSKVLTEIDSFYGPQIKTLASYADFSQDLNADGLADVLSTNFTGINVYLQQANGEFISQQLSFSPEQEIEGRQVIIKEPSSFSFDVNGDSKADLVLQRDNFIHIFKQLADGKFSPQAQTINLNAGILDAQQIKLIDEQDDNESPITRFHQFKDLDGDGMMDLITRTAVPGGMFGGKAEYDIRFANRDAQNQLVYAAKSDVTLKPKGQSSVTFDDINNDGLADYSMFSLELGVGAMMSFVSGSLDGEMSVYRMQQARQYVEKADYNTEIEIQINTDTGNGGRQVFRMADFNGDGLKDLLIQHDDDELRIHQGGNSPLFAKQKTKLKALLPKSGDLVEVEDFNHDGKADILIRYAKQDGKEREKSLVLLLSQSSESVIAKQ
jgi:hypothetical protein